MARTTMLRAQHDTAEGVLDEVFEAIEAYGGESDAYPLSMKVARLAGILRTHFAMEAQTLYPFMMASEDRETAVMARMFKNEMGNLGPQFDRFVTRWMNSDAIAGAFSQFSYEAGMLFGALRECIHRENRDLYPLADALIDGPPSKPAPELLRAG